ncbi:MAG TPA: alpha/beta hydrolase fold domain-containing protein [Acidobacteriaceae bacterium]|nr:alpha/beta hydrolase fold domain-containing protein [Acidobacteriaceae bacterium]
MNRICTPLRVVGVLTFCLATASLATAQTDSSTIQPDGTAIVTRIVPVPKTISPEAQRMLARQVSDAAVPQTLAERRTHTDEWQNRTGKVFQQKYPVTVETGEIAGVPVRIVTPLTVPAAKRDRVLINLHGGGFNSDSGSLTESIPVAFLTQTKVVAVLYRLAPEHPFPAALDDSIAVYRELLKTHKPENIGIFGTSAGAILTGEVAVRIRDLGVPLPKALGIFSGFGDFSTSGDSTALYALNGFSGHLDPPQAKDAGTDEYAAKLSLKDPSLSILYANLHGLPSTLFITSGRDMLLSGTTILQRAFLRAGDDAPLVVFEALPHAFWNDPSLPETREANEVMANFFDSRLGKHQ